MSIYIGPSIFFLICFTNLSSFDAYSSKEVSPFNQQKHNVNEEKILGLSATPPKVGWVDPYDMMKESIPQSLYVQSDVDSYTLSNRLKKCDIYLRRFVNLFLQVVTPRTATAEVFESQFYCLGLFA